MAENYTGDYSGILCGFTYNGVHSSTYHVDYIPDANDRWFEGTDWNVYDTDVAWHDGGYYYGNAAKVKTFTLNCFYEEITIKQREDIRKWLHRNSHGQLIFDDLPFVYWNVRPTKMVTGNEYNDSGRYSGTFSIEFRAYDPFGYLTRKSNSGSETDNATDYCDLIATGSMPAVPTVTDRNFSVYNPGREVCGLTIRIAGSSSNPIEFLNTTNETRCIIPELPAGGLILDINGDTGKITTYMSGGQEMAELGYAYHDRGFVRLEPGTNTIAILEQNSSGNWGPTSSLSLTHFTIDYSPRIL